MAPPEVTVVGAGLAGCEAAWQLAIRGVSVRLWDMKPGRYTPAHRSPLLAELVCSNSLRGDRLENAAGLLKAELRRLGSLILACADEARVPAGGALAVDREDFARRVTARVEAHPRIVRWEGEVETVPEGDCIVATGPLTAGALAADIRRLLGGGCTLYFFDAAAPLVSFESLDMDRAWFGSRYGRGDDYINCPLDKVEYLAFREALASAEEAGVHGFEDARVFEGCMPVEVMARRGEDTLRYGPLKPVGLRSPDGRAHYAVLQLRRDNAAGTVYNLVGCQTHLTFGEQKRVFALIPALRRAEFLRYGVMHRNTYLDAPRLLTEQYALRRAPHIVFAGQMTGVEGYVESCASGLTAGIGMARRLYGSAPLRWPETTAVGALARYIANPAVTEFQPMNINFGLLPPLDRPVRAKAERYAALSARALAETEALCPEIWEHLENKT
ncbi:MAG: methylenetetrahydrofolate--tRNA-(uracil(54)-C(5))-methyltransferase (FADH(2)-oxidizing) TrmFO [Oscillospiraceae bacterium]|jgi:methylenetetrahydrofolate--tRNA-(uracil-5-)-methyltransferase|nr:methylenetetrahydrofolate--tRNA-(uracil(54)-C(5))-methyltransferase (FADH(2)-oxidizing) TrmFO [Oscillospiraceae bacterium]